MDSERRPRLTPAIADVRRAVREALAGLAAHPNHAPALPNHAPAPPNHAYEGLDSASVPKSQTFAEDSDRDPSQHRSDPSQRLLHGPRTVLVALSGGPDSLALAAATAFEAPRAGFAAGAVIINHGLQAGSADVAAAAARQATSLGLSPVLVREVTVGMDGGPEAAARTARYAALASAAEEVGASAVLLGHTLDDQAETVLLGLARGSGATSLHGMERESGLYLRPLLGIRRSTTVQFCLDSGIEAWSDPHNADAKFARVRVRNSVLPLLEAELGPGVTEALARTAEHLREDSDALDRFAEEIVEELAEVAEAGISLPVKALESNPAALRQRLIRLAVQGEFHVSLTRSQTLEVARLVTDWHGQGSIDLPGIKVERRDGLIVFSAADQSNR